MQIRHHTKVRHRPLCAVTALIEETCRNFLYNSPISWLIMICRSEDGAAENCHIREASKDDKHEDNFVNQIEITISRVI